MPIAASWPARSGSSASTGSSCTSSSTSSKNEKSLAWTVLKASSAMLTNSFSRGLVGLGERIDPRLLHRRHAPERAQHHPVRERRRAVDEVAVGLLALVAGRQEEVLAALRPGRARRCPCRRRSGTRSRRRRTATRAAPRSPSGPTPAGRGTSCRRWSRCSASGTGCASSPADRCSRSRAASRCRPTRSPSRATRPTTRRARALRNTSMPRMRSSAS